MTDSARYTVYTIPAGISFVDALASQMLDATGGESAELAAYTILLPTRRAVRSLREAFLRLTDGAPLLLPRMMPLGDLDEEELAIAGWDEFLGDGGGDIPPAISSMRRQLLLSRLVQGFGDDNMSAEQAALLAGELARLLDQAQTEGLSFDKLENLVPGEFAEHWQVTLEFLTIVTEAWPKILEDENCIDPAKRRNLLLDAEAKRWRDHPPGGPIIAAGSTGSIPATAELLSIVAGLPQGCLVLPGLDRDIDADSLKELEPSHPQFGMVQLLDRLEMHPSDVAPWPAPDLPATDLSRAELINNALRPAATTDSWRDLPPPPPEALENVVRVDCPSLDEEARVIALMMREALEIPDKTVALVTPERRLARRVTAELGRWEIEVDDSAGHPLAQTPPGSFLRLTAELAANGFSPLSLLGAGKHPLAALNRKPVELRNLIRRLEVGHLRGPRPSPGLKGLQENVIDQDLRALLTDLSEVSDEFTLALESPQTTLIEIVHAHVQFAEAFAASDNSPGGDRLWAGDAGEAAAGFIAEMIDAADGLGDIPGYSYPALLDVLMTGRAVRPRFGAHPRLFIWGLLEARLQHADLVILGGLNEGTWPPEAEVDPWMSRPMRSKFGLPAPERRIGLTAHDFTQAFSAPEVALTRSLRVDGSPTVPSRWLTRLEKLTMNVDTVARSLMPSPWLHWQSALDQPAKQMAGLKPPAPMPPVSARPRKLWVTHVETWMRDPYAIYARYILGLKALEPLDAAPDAADYGTLIHKALNDFTRAYPGELPADAEQQLIAFGEAQFQKHDSYPGVRAFWWPRFLRIAKWFVETEVERRPDVKHLFSEITGKLSFPSDAGPFTLSAKADRIDVMTDGSLRIIDYKTGAPPSKKEIAAGFAPQLPLEAVIGQDGGFEDVDAAPVSALDFWRLRGSVPAGEEVSAGNDPAALAEEALEGLQALVRAFDRVETPYESRPRPDAAPKYSDYEHLARIKEWSAAEGDD